MTRDFNKQSRNDERPSFRKPSSGRYGDERASRPARPRLNRETVDRAWESGAPQNHADYRSRNTNNGQAPQNGRRNYRDGQKPAYPSQYGRNENRPYGNRTDNYNRSNNYQHRDNDRYSNRSNDTYQDRHPRSFDANRRPAQNSRFNDRRSYSDGPNDTHGANRANNVRSYQTYRDNAPFRGTDRRTSDRNFERPQREFERDFRGPNRYGSNRDERPARGDYQDRQQRPYRPYAQERPAPARRQYDDALFEGDYEGVGQEHSQDMRFQRPERTERPRRNTFARNDKPNTEDHHVTRLPDGRVLKGPRPVQRKNAEFWNEIEQDTEGLLDHIQVPAAEPLDEAEADSASDEHTPRETTEEYATGTEGKAVHPARKPRSRVASAVARNKKAATAKPRSTGPRPSQRGFKWPSQ